MQTQQATLTSVASNELRDMARVRINARVGSQRHPMVGLIPRDVLNEIRRRIRNAVADGYDCAIEATPTRAQKVHVAGGGERSSGWKVNLLMRVTTTERTSDALPEMRAIIQVELTGLLEEAQQVAQGAVGRVLAKP